MKRLLLLLSLTLTATLAKTTTKNIELEATTQHSSHIVTREVRTFRVARSSREIRTFRVARSLKEIRIERRSRTLRFINVSARLERASRVARITHHVVKIPTAHLASSD